jgi:hypothetical protein
MPAMSAKEMARELGTDARTFRKFMRSITPKEEQPGQGKRWAFKGTKKEIDRFRKQFENWNVPRMTEAEGPGADVVDDEEIGLEAIQEEEDLLGEYIFDLEEE